MTTYIHDRFLGRQVLNPLSEDGTGRKMMEFSKQVLQKVEFDRRLFRQGAPKARRWIGQHDQLVLKARCPGHVRAHVQDVILEVFQTTMRS